MGLPAHLTEMIRVYLVYVHSTVKYALKVSHHNLLSLSSCQLTSAAQGWLHSPVGLPLQMSHQELLAYGLEITETTAHKGVLVMAI